MTLSYSVAIDFDGDGAWNTAGDDITAYVESWSESIGITDYRARVADVGMLSITVNNASKAFSPAYTSGPYYGKLLPGKPVRVQITDGVTTWDAFRGVTRAFKPASGEYGARTATIECADFLQVLQDQMISLPIQEGRNMAYLLKLIGSATWRTASATGTVTFADQPANLDYIVIDGYTYQFVTTVSAANHVLIGATLEATVDNLVAAINGGAGSGTAYGASTTRPGYVTAQPQPTYYRSVLADNPLRYYRLGEIGTTTATDSGQNGANGTRNFTPLGLPGALTNDPDGSTGFDGVGYYISTRSLDFANRNFCIEAWIYPYASGAPAQQIFFAAHSAAAPGQSLHLRVKSDGTLYIGFWGNDFETDPGVVPFDDWTHVALNYHYATDTFTLYVNGAEVISNNIGPFVGVDPVVEIGRGVGATEYWNGAVDELSIHWRNLTAERIAAHYAARAVAPGILLSANARGAWGNTITLVKSGANVAVSGATLSGGVDGPVGLFSYEDGRQTFDVAGDLWSTGETNGLDAVTDTVTSEWGLFWQARDGTLTAKDRDYVFEQNAATPALTLSSEHNALEFDDDFDLLWNRVIVRFTPRGALSAGVVARAKSIIAVPALSGNDRWNPSTDLDKSGFVAPDAGLFVTTLPYVDTGGGGKLIGAQSLTLPLVAGTDYTIGDKSDGTNSSSDYNYTTGTSLSFSVAATGSGVEVSIKNTAIGNLYVKDLQVRGIGLIAYDAQEAIVEDGASMDAYGRRAESIDLPLTSSSTFAYALATYLLSRHKEPTPRVSSLAFRGQTSVGAVNLFSIDIGETIALTDAQTGLVSHRYLVTGLEYNVTGGVPFAAEITLYVRRLDDAPYLIIGDATYGLIGTNTIAL
jgi:hypothetical protein